MHRGRAGLHLLISRLCLDTCARPERREMSRTATDDERMKRRAGMQPSDIDEDSDSGSDAGSVDGGSDDDDWGDENGDENEATPEEQPSREQVCRALSIVGNQSYVLLVVAQAAAAEQRASIQRQEVLLSQQQQQSPVPPVHVNCEYNSTGRRERRFDSPHACALARSQHHAM